MPRVRVESPGTIGTRVWLNDVEVQDLTNVVVSHPVDDVMRVQLNVLARESFRFEAADAHVTVEVKAFPGFRVEMTPQPDGRVIFRAIPDTAEDGPAEEREPGICGADW